MDTADSPSVPEFRIICAAARDAGIEALHATLGEAEYDGSVLRVQGEPVHLVYRRALLEDLPEGDLIAAARDRRAAVVNPFRARAWRTTRSCSRCSGDPRFAHLVQDAERQVIAETIPWTRVLREGRAEYGDWVVDLLAFVSDNRERLVIKPASDYGGHGVSLGMETSPGRTGTG